MESGGARCDRREASGEGKGQCNRPTGRTSMRTHCGNIWRRGCPLPKSRRRSMPSSRPPIPAMPRLAAPGEWELPAPTAPRICQGIGPRRRKPHHCGLANRANAIYPPSSGRCRRSSARRPSSSAASRSIRAMFRSQSSSLTIAVTPTAATKRATPSPFAVTRGAQAQAIALHIFI